MQSDVFLTLLMYICTIIVGIIVAFFVMIIGIYFLLSIICRYIRKQEENEAALRETHAKWTWKDSNPDNYDCICSNCGAEEEHLYPYCPNCGAKMDLINNLEFKKEEKVPPRAQGGKNRC